MKSGKLIFFFFLNRAIPPLQFQAWGSRPLSPKSSERRQGGEPVAQNWRPAIWRGAGSFVRPYTGLTVGRPAASWRSQVANILPLQPPLDPTQWSWESCWGTRALRRDFFFSGGGRSVTLFTGLVQRSGGTIIVQRWIFQVFVPYSLVYFNFQLPVPFMPSAWKHIHPFFPLLCQNRLLTLLNGAANLQLDRPLTPRNTLVCLRHRRECVSVCTNESLTFTTAAEKLCVYGVRACVRATGLK